MSDIQPGQIFNHYDGLGACTRSVLIVDVTDGRARCTVVSDRDDRMVNVELTISVGRLSQFDWCQVA